MNTEILGFLNEGNAAERLANLRKLVSEEKCPPPVLNQYANNHIHTTYSFSPYSPTAAVWFAREAGLPTAGIMDHDSISGAWEFIEAGSIAGVATTVGLECRVSVAGTPLEGRRINNPDQKSVAYMALHGVPHHQIDFLSKTFAPFREMRNNRNIEMVDNINSLFAGSGVSVNFEDDVLPVSSYSEGGSVTERHIMYALAKKLFEKGDVEETLGRYAGIKLSEKQRAAISSDDDGFVLYRLLGILKSSLIRDIYVPASDELLHISELATLAKKVNAVLCYAYLGDVKNSVTGDKADMEFEDGYLDILFAELKKQGVDAITYMPSRNTPAQLSKVMSMCREYGFGEISGEDINSPGQSFICPQLAQPEFSHLIDATWSLIERERALTED